MEQVYVPSLIESEVNGIVSTLQKQNDDFSLNFSKMYKVRCFEMMIFLMNVLQLKKSNTITIDDDFNKYGASYARTMKLYDAINDFDLVSASKINSNFTTITKIDYSFLYDYYSQVTDWHQGLEAYSADLANIIIKENHNLEKVIEYCIREIIRNTLEHNIGYGREYCNVFIVAQVHKSDKKAELVFADNGVGIRRTLSNINKFGDNIKTDSDALKLAVQPGISSESCKNEGDWSNSGFGLYVTSEIMKKIGSFTLYSMDGGIKIDSGGIHTVDNAYIPGTIIKLEVNYDIFLEESSKDFIDKLVKQGESFASKNSNAIKTASKKSRTI